MIFSFSLARLSLSLTFFKVGLFHLSPPHSRPGFPSISGLHLLVPALSLSLSLESPLITAALPKPQFKCFRGLREKERRERVTTEREAAKPDRPKPMQAL